MHFNESTNVKNPTTIVQELDNKKIKITTRTLLNYENDKLIPQPERRGGGRGVGKITEYPSDTVYEFIASYRLINGAQHRLSPAVVREYRKYALTIEKRMWTSEELVEEYSKNMVNFFGAFLWLAYRDLAKIGICGNEEAKESKGVQYFLENDNSVLVKKFNDPDENGNIKMGVVWT
ncbi:hypothetical protein [Sporomusa sphaeroides]|uniref:HTH merR-type domain-containing protein n=1 Tax=Sporomusa sphaeroides DSM 2875 TaxID=1337886 RepID=A0ABP2C2E4_9FIRM|nr:hypothetical protein [Sporomusa sphaeroides]OLS56308.1 hypothetical protein SPSPH_27010 [Sporomusa sphaeroides DSM 2875]CVK18403.1 hypothetical protein SSPH_01041 [Sporomusa sphaeroides DSM 2875]